MREFVEPLERRVCFNSWTLIAENVARATIQFTHGPDSFVAATGGTYYIGYDRAHGSELWHVPHGGAARLVKDVRPGKKSSSVELLGTSDGIVFFAASDGVNGRWLWRSDGTAAGTVALRRVSAAAGGAAIEGGFIFAADDGVHGTELWRTDGTSRGTVMLTELRPGAAGSAPRHFTLAENKVFFTATLDASANLYVTDGTKRGTVRLAATGAPGNYLDVAKLGGTFVIGNDANLWATDGATARGTMALGTSLTLRNLAAGPRSVLFAGPGEHLWETDGTVNGTRAVAGLPDAFDKVVGIGRVAGGAIVHTGSNIDGEIWFTDGSRGSVRQLLARRASAFHIEHTSFNDVHLFTHVGGYWQTDGTQAGTFKVPLGTGPDGIPLEGPLRLVGGQGHLQLISGFTMDPQPPGEGYMRRLWSYTPAGAIGGVVFDDTSGDGRLQSTEARLGGFRVYADANGNGRFDAGEASTRSDARGGYHLAGLRPGRHRLRIVGAGAFAAPAAGWVISIDPGEVERRYLGVFDT